jgi:hypothetical protein
MKITLFQTADSLDPAGLADNPEASLTAYIKEVSAEILKAYPGVEIEHSNQNNWHSFCLDTDLDDQSEIEDAIQTIGEDVYATGNFWA